jgi:alpha-beta hydrolase superfamily lysophospholipase
MKHNEDGWQSDDGIYLYAQAWEPETDPAAVICLVHGLGEHSGRYGHVAQHLVGNEFAVLAFDLRGHGRSAGQLGHAPSFDACMDDIDLLLKNAGDQYPGKPRFLYGHSLGGMQVLNYALRRKGDLAGVISTGSALRSEIENQTFKVALSKILGSVVPKLSIPSGLNPNMLSRDPEVIDAYINDPLVHDRATLGFANNSLQAIRWVYENAPKFNVPLLLMHGSQDKVAFPEGAEEFADLVQENCTLKMWQGLYHEVHNEPEYEAVLEYLVGWIKTTLQREP